MSDIFPILLCLNVVFFVLGWILGKISSQPFFGTRYDSAGTRIESHKRPSKIAIDETKYVTEIKTDDLIIKYDSLAETKVSSENISNSVNKLKNMKG